MKAQCVYENLKFERGIDPKKALNLGVIEQIRNYLIENDLEKDPRKLEQDEILLDWACELDKLDWVENLLKMGVSPNADPDNPLDSGCLDEASFKGNIPLMELLLKYGADVTHKNYISLRYAAGEGHFNAVKLLLEAGADPFVFSGEDLSTRPLRNLTNIVKLILKYQEKAKESFVKESYNFERGKEPKSSLEIGRRARIYNEARKAGWTIPDDESALIWAATYNQMDDLKYLYEEGADYTAFNNEAFTSAAENGSFDAVKFLVGLGVDIHDNNEYALRYATKNSKYDIMEYLLNLGANPHINFQGGRMDNYLLDRAEHKGDKKAYEILSNYPPERYFKNISRRLEEIMPAVKQY